MPCVSIQFPTFIWLQRKRKMFCAITCSWLALFVMRLSCVDSSNDPKCLKFARPGCSCVWLDTIRQITCNNTADISTLPKLLDSAFGIDETYEIILEHFSEIPPGIIEGLNVFRLIVDSPETADVSQNAFDGVSKLQCFYVYLSSLTRIPNFRNVTHSLKQVRIDNSLLTKVEDELQNLPLLTSLSLRNNSLAYVQTDAFYGTTATEILDLSHNKLVSLPESLFDEFTELSQLNLSYNSLHTVHGLFKNLGAKLKFLSLEFNNLSDADDILQSNMSKLEYLSLNNNPLRKLSVKTFNGTVPGLATLWLSHCNLTHFKAEYFKGLTLLRLLDLSFNQIKHISREEITFGDDLELLMQGNEMKSFDGVISKKMRKLFLAENTLEHLGDMITYTKLSEVDVSFNHLRALEKKNFMAAHKLQIIRFRYNYIEKIDSHCFESAVSSLHYLDLSGNSLTSLNNSLQFLSVLNTLDISDNLLKTLDYEELKGLNELSSLHLQNNRIVALSGKVQNLPNLQHLTLNNNQISQLNMDKIPRTLRYLFIKGNPFKCNCQLYNQFLNRLKSSVLELNIIPCTQSNASEDLSHHPCPSPCCCYCDGDLIPSAISVNCSYRYLTLIPAELSGGPPSLSPQERSYRMDDLRFIIHDRIVSLDLSNNNIKSVEGVHFSRNLEKLYLSNNYFTTLPYDVMNLPKLQKMSLSGNKWKCTCDRGKAVEFRNWLLPEDRHVVDINKTLCYNLDGGKVIVSVSETDICPGNAGLYLICGLVVLGILSLIFVIIIVYTRYKFSIKSWLLSKGIVQTKQKDARHDKTLDVFLSFSNEDRDFVVGQIVPEIEVRCPDVNIFSEGIYLYEELMKERKLHSASPLEKITMIVVTRNFLEDKSCLSVMRIHKQEHDDFHPMMVISVGDLPPDWEESVASFVPNATYLQWGDTTFWHNFINSLPHTPEPTSGNERNFPPLVTSEL